VNVGVAPFQTPFNAVSVLSWIGEPMIDGGVELTGAFVGAAFTTPVGLESRTFRPAELVAASCTASR
jgi:hypothetical protein